MSSTQWNYIGIETFLAELGLALAGLGWVVAPRHPEDVAEPFRETFRGLLFTPLLALLN